MHKIPIRKLLDESGVAWATFFYVGRLPKAPGTFGSLAALPLAWLVWGLPPVGAWAIVLAVFLSGAWAAGVVGKRSGTSDDQTIVIDEVVGILITTSVAERNWWQYLLAFLLFRLFDIWKPWPVRWVDRHWHSAVGTMMDDALAGALAMGVLYAGRRVTGH